MRIFFVFLLLSFSNLVQGQELVYAVSVNGHPCGTSTVTKTSTADNQYRIDLNMKLDIDLFIKVHMRFEGFAEYQEGGLKRSEARMYNNEHLHSTTITEHGEAGYRIVKNKKNLVAIEEKIRYSGYDLYFQYPKDLDALYSLSAGKMQRIEKVDAKELKVIDAAGNHSLYKYNDTGEVEYVKIHHHVYDIEFKLNP